MIRQHPALYLQAYGRGLLRLAGPDHDVLPQLVVSGRQKPLVDWMYTASLLQLLVTYAAAACGVYVALASASGRRALVVPLTFIGYFLVVAGPEVYARFRVPMMPFIVILGGAGFSAWRAARGRGGAALLASAD